ncbi:kinase-like domain-containing protein [Trametes maxima]|nr:kinase-like domain-containing protein [Trametes maxima]
MSKVNADESSKLPTWAEISSYSNKELYELFESSTHRFPCPSPVHSWDVRRIASDAVMKIGPLQASEPLAMQCVRETSTVPVPAVFRYFPVGDAGPRALVMQYIPGKTLADSWPGLSLWRRFLTVWTIRGHIRQMRRVRVPDTLVQRKTTFPGPIASEPQMCYGTMFTEYGAGPFASYDELTAWFMHKMDVNRRFMKYPPHPMTFDSSMPLVLSHMDLFASNIILGDDGKVWFIDWEFAGFYPQWFEYATMREGWHILGRWQKWIVGFMAGFYEQQLHFISSVAWALNLGILL